MPVWFLRLPYCWITTGLPQLLLHLWWSALLKSWSKMERRRRYPSTSIIHSFLHVRVSGSVVLCGLPDFIIWKSKLGLTNGPLGGKHLSPYTQFKHAHLQSLGKHGKWSSKRTEPTTGTRHTLVPVETTWWRRKHTVLCHSSFVTLTVLGEIDAAIMLSEMKRLRCNVTSRRSSSHRWARGPNDSPAADEK